MSYTYGFFDAVDLGSGNYDRVYSSAEFSHYWALLVGDGVFGQPSTSLNVLAMEPVAMNVKVAPGTGWIKGHYLTVPDNMDEVIAVPVANPTLPRIDSIIMALNNTDRDMKLYVRSGTAAASPKAVTLQRDADVWELELAQITVAAGAGNITQQAIKDMRTDPDRCGIVTGLIDQFDVSGFLTAAQASFDEWFENVQNQLGDDVAGNLLNLINEMKDPDSPGSLQSQINQNKQSISNLSDSVANLKKGLSSPLDVGGVFLMVSTYDEEITDALPCTGGVYSPEAYPDLFQVVGYNYGAHIPVSASGPIRAGSQRTCIDPVTGNLYVAEGGTIYVYGDNGGLLRTGVPYSSGENIDQMVAYNNVVAVYSRNSNSRKYPCVSKDGGLTWGANTTYTMGNAGSTSCIGICGDFIYFGVNYNSGTYGARYRVSTGQWDRNNLWTRTHWYTNAGRSDLAFGNNDGTLYRMNSSGNWSNCGISLRQNDVSPNGGVIIDNYLYTVNSSGNLIKVNSGGSLVKTHTGVSFTGLACATKLNNGALLFFDYNSSQTSKIYALLEGEDTLREAILSSGKVSASYFSDCCVINSQLKVASRDSRLYKGLATLNFQVPNITLDKTMAYIRTKAYGR